jgi:hypothetical protein
MESRVAAGLRRTLGVVAAEREELRLIWLGALFAAEAWALL